VTAPSPSLDALNLATQAWVEQEFRIEVARCQRRSDGTVSLAGMRPALDDLQSVST